MLKCCKEMRWFSLFFLLSWTACQDNKEVVMPLHFPDLMEIPNGFPTVIEPEGNVVGFEY
jgi:hypothetical protein